MRLLKVNTVIFLSAFIVACNDSPTPDITTPDFNTLIQQEYVQPFKAGDTEKWLQIFADDVMALHNTLPAFIGKDAVQQFGQMVATNLHIEQMDVTIDEVRVNGTWALTRGSFTSKLVPKNVEDSSAIDPQTGKFIFLWEQQDDKSWKIILDMGNSNI